jgi:hypothetical protein
MCGRLSLGFVVSFAVIVVSRIRVPASSSLALFEAQLTTPALTNPARISRLMSSLLGSDSLPPPFVPLVRHPLGNVARLPWLLDGRLPRVVGRIYIRDLKWARTLDLDHGLAFGAHVMRVVCRYRRLLAGAQCP